MTITTSSTTTQPIQDTQRQLTVVEVQERLATLVVATIQAIVKDNQERMAGYKENTKLLDRGVFYSCDYINALREQNQTARLKYFIDKGHFLHGYAPNTDFRMQQDDSKPTNLVCERFILKEGVKPSVALESIRKGPSLLGCGETCQIAFYEAVKAVIGTEKFDLLFAANSSSPLTIHFDTLDNPLERLLIRKPFKSLHSVKKGQIVGFRNIPAYPMKHINGIDSAFVTICCDDTPNQQTFTTLGLIHEGMTQEQIGEKLREGFNNNPLDASLFVTKKVVQKILQSFPPGFLTQTERLANTTLSRQEFLAQNGGQPTDFTVELNAERITILANCSLESLNTPATSRVK